MHHSDLSPLGKRLLCLAAILMALLFALPQCARATLPDLDALEAALARRPHHLARKEARIDSIKALIKPLIPVRRRLELYDRLYEEYLTYSFDSTMAYVRRCAELLPPDADYDLRSHVEIRRARSLATSGRFSDAAEVLGGIHSERLRSDQTRREYFATMEWTYAVWAEHAYEAADAPALARTSLRHLDSLILLTPAGTPDHAYLQAERELRLHRYEAAERLYLSAAAGLKPDTRLYAQTAYALASTYHFLGQGEQMEQWLVRAAIADQVTPLKENLALQQLAIRLKTRYGDLERSNRYLKFALEDAIFYNNRLRMLEIARHIPDIALLYQDTVAAQNKRLQHYVGLIALLLVAGLGGTAVIVRQKRRAVAARAELARLNERLNEANSRLNASNAQLNAANSRLNASNAQLTLTDRSRENYVSLFMDLSAAYIEKINRFQSTVVNKIKARQVDDLLRIAGNSRLSEAEMRELFFNFDTTFMRLYPDFITQFNSLLRPDAPITPRAGELLNTDLRIFALVRLGITDSNKIATLLFYSPQTVFNHRTAVRNRAIDRDSFERQVMQICRTA